MGPGRAGPGGFSDHRGGQSGIFSSTRRATFRFRRAARCRRAATSSIPSSCRSPIDEARLDPQDNLEEFSRVSTADLAHLKTSVKEASRRPGAVVANFGGTGSR